MRFRKYVLPVVLSVTFFGSPMAMADEDQAVKQMAQILINLNHHPSSSEKQTLQGIIDNASSSEADRIIARAIANLDHKASPADKEQLQALVNELRARNILDQSEANNLHNAWHIRCNCIHGNEVDEMHVNDLKNVVKWLVRKIRK